MNVEERDKLKELIDEIHKVPELEDPTFENLHEFLKNSKKIDDMLNEVLSTLQGMV
jgi:hypothetical protein